MSAFLQPRGLLKNSVHGISQARIQEWVAISFSKEYSPPRDQTCISCIAGGFFTAEPPGKPTYMHSKYKYKELADIIREAKSPNM